MANIRDIAKITGYSVSTISRVINNHPYVDDKKREKVLKVMAELNYVPNRSAQNLSFGKTKNIGVILPFVNHEYYDQMLSGIMQAAFDHGYQISLLPTNYDQELEKRYLAEFAKRAFDGLIVTTKANSIKEFFDYFKYGPIIFCEEIPNADASCVYINLKQSTKEAFSYMKEKGIKRPGMTLGRSKNIRILMKQIFFGIASFQKTAFKLLNFLKLEKLMVFSHLVMKLPQPFYSSIKQIGLSLLDEKIC